MASRLSVKALSGEMVHGEMGDNISSAAFSRQDLSDCHQTLHDYLVCHFNRIIMDRSDCRLRQFTSSETPSKFNRVFHEQLHLKEKSGVNLSIALLYEVKCCL